MENNKQIARRIFSLAYPVIIENILQVSMGFADKYFVSRVGTNAVISVGVTTIVMNIYLSFFIAVGVGTTAVVSRYIGAGENEKASMASKQAFYIALFIGIIVGIFNLIFHKKILGVVGLDYELLDFASPYFLVITVPSVFLSILLMISSSLRGAKDTKTPMKVSLIGNVINVILNPILIFGIFQFEGLGLLGAGIATTISRIVIVIILIIKLKNKNSVIKFNIFKNLKLDKSYITNIIKIGMPVALERLSMRIGQLVYTGFIIYLGTKVYAAYSIAGVVESFAYIPGLGFGVAAATLVGNSLGSKDVKRAYKYGLWSYYLGTLLIISIGMISFIFAPQLASIFTQDQEIIEYIVYIVRRVVLMQPFTATTLIITPALQGAGDTKLPMIYTLLGIWVFRVLGCYLLVYKLEMNISAVILMVAFDLIVRSVLLLKRFKQKKWAKIDILKS